MTDQYQPKPEDRFTFGLKYEKLDQLTTELLLGVR
jgi:hypothetical protein